MCTHRSHRCIQSYMNIMLCCLKCKFLLLYSMERICRKSDFLQHAEVKKFKWQSQQRRKMFFFFFLLVPCLNLNLILVLSFGKVLLTPVQGYFHCSLRCSFTEFCPTLGTWQLQGCVTFTKGWQTHRSRNFQYPHPWNPWTWWNRPSVEENPLQHKQRALEYPI